LRNAPFFPESFPQWGASTKLADGLPSGAQHGAAHAQTFEPNAMGGLSYRDPNTGMLVGNARPNVNGGYVQQRV
jgi:hypothetical protein